MKFTQEAVEKSMTYLTQDTQDTQDSQSDRSASSTPAPEPSPTFQALKGYSLYKHHTKLHAIVDFLRLSSFNPIITSNDQSIIARLECICEEPKLIVKRMKGPDKFPSKWTSQFCAQFICDVVDCIEEDKRISEANTTRKNLRKRNTTSTLPPAASTLLKMVEQARLKVRGDAISRKRKNPKLKTTKDYLIKSTVHNPNFVEITSEQILDNLLCPMCNHRSLVSLTTKEEAELANQILKDSFDQKMSEWSARGRKGSKPRMGKTHSQVLGCVCYMQNCIGNDDGSGCFKCKTLEGMSVGKTADKG